MSRIAYVNGQYLPLAYASVNIEDRGYQFADGVYEGIAVRRGRIKDLEPHLDRLERSLAGLNIDIPMQRGPLKVVLREVVHRNRTRDGFLYVQVTRGVAKRDHAFPLYAAPALTVTCHRLDFDKVVARAKTGILAVSNPDIRWGRCDLKTICLLPNVLAKQHAREASAFEAVLVDSDGYVTEGSSTNIWMVDKNGTLITRATADNILPGITRALIADAAAELGTKIEQRAFTLEEACGAKEMFLTSTTSCAMPIVGLDGRKIGDGKPGPVASRLLAAYMDRLDQI